MNREKDNALEGVIHGLIERHISQEQAMERLREIVQTQNDAELTRLRDLNAELVGALEFITENVNKYVDSYWLSRQPDYRLAQHALAKAKGACQAHYEALIMSALEVV